MERIRFGKTGLMVSRVAFGGIPIMRVMHAEAVRIIRGVLDMDVNFIDTAHVYGDSEEKIGSALKGIDRARLVIASKSPAGDRKTLLEHVDLSLKRMGLDYIDIYQLHNIATPEKEKEVFASGGAYEGLAEAVEAGKVRFAGFSSHSIPLALEIMKKEKFASVQLPINFIDNAAEKEAVPLAKKLDMGFIAMKPLGGGLLEDAGVAFRYLMQFDGIVPDPGIEKLEEMREIAGLVNSRKALSEEDRALIESLRTELGPAWCHRCDYCQPCPQGIVISNVLTVKSFLKRMPFQRARSMLADKVEKAKTCILCNACIQRCPYNLKIPELLKKGIAAWTEAAKAAAV
jgi:predicted aldo/keto reductase-like oxidoreductase